MTDRAADHFDTLITGGHTIDPDSGALARSDIGIAGGRISSVAPAIEGVTATHEIDATGLLVTPGLVDAHTHLFPAGTFWGFSPSSMAGRSGVTTWVDAGSAGGYNFSAFVADTERLPVRCYALLNISGIGLTARTGESTHIDWCDESLCEDTIRAHPSRIVGIKVRIDRETVGANGYEPLRRAIRVGDRTYMPVMVHVGEGPPAIEGVLELMRPGDILTHFATHDSMGLVDARGRIKTAARDAVDRGIIFDLGHGGGSFSFAVAERLSADGLFPAIISTDLHRLSLANLDPGLTNCMSKLLSLGMPLPRVMAAVTRVPADVLRLPPGTGELLAGGPADLALLELRESPLRVRDAYGDTRTLSSYLLPRMTIKDGHVLAARKPCASDRMQHPMDRGDCP